MDTTNTISSLDTKHINIHENYEVEIWANKFHVTPDQLKLAVNAVGELTENVAAYLKK